MNANVIQDLINSSLKEGLSHKLVKDDLSIIKNILSYAQKKYNINDISYIDDVVMPKKAKISNYETGYITPQQDDLFEIAHALNISIDDLFPQRKKFNDITTIYNQLTPPRQHNVLDFANHQLELQNSNHDTLIELNTYRNDDTNEIAINGYVSADTGEQIIDEPIYSKQT